VHNSRSSLCNEVRIRSAGGMPQYVEVVFLRLASWEVPVRSLSFCRGLDV
jgi:hypothetical protein